jgi:hypothetical protein
MVHVRNPNRKDCEKRSHTKREDKIKIDLKITVEDVD